MGDYITILYIVVHTIIDQYKTANPGLVFPCHFTEYLYSKVLKCTVEYDTKMYRKNIVPYSSVKYKSTVYDCRVADCWRTLYVFLSHVSLN